MFLSNVFAFPIWFAIPILAIGEFLPGLFGGAIATWLGLMVGKSGVKNIIRCWRIRTTDSVPIAAAVRTNGLVQIQGHVQPSPSSDALMSPIQNEQCVAYEYKLKHQIEGTGDGYIDSGTESNSFIVSDGTGKILVNPTADSLSLTTNTNTVAGRKEMLEQVDVETVDLDASARTEDSGIIKNPVELTEGTVSVGEQITVVGKAVTAPERGAADAVMSPKAKHLTVMNDEPENTALRTGALGTFSLIFGLIFGIFGLAILTSVLSNII
jgi:hypothetical protein